MLIAAARAEVTPISTVTSTVWYRWTAPADWSPTGAFQVTTADYSMGKEEGYWITTIIDIFADGGNVGTLVPITTATTALGQMCSATSFLISSCISLPAATFTANTAYLIRVGSDGPGILQCVHHLHWFRQAGTFPHWSRTRELLHQYLQAALHRT